MNDNYPGSQKTMEKYLQSRHVYHMPVPQKKVNLGM